MGHTASLESTAARSIQTEIALQRLVIAYVIAGLLFMLLPGTFLGVWNLLSITSRHALGNLSPAWLQAHGYAQVFGWIGTFIIGIGYYSLSKMGGLAPFAVSRGWVSWGLWTTGVALRWIANVTEIEWRVLLPLSAVMQIGGFLVFFATVSHHKPKSGTVRRQPIETWMKLVMISTIGFLLALGATLAEAVRLAWTGAGPAIPHWLDQRYLVLCVWGFPVLAVWGFNARWLPVFLGLRKPSSAGLIGAVSLLTAGVAMALAGQFGIATVLLLAASMLATAALNVFRRALKPAKTVGITAFFPYFVRGAYAWLLAAAALGVYAARVDATGGVWGASRHALTVGFLASMVFAIGQRVLPAFCGMRILYSKRLMLASLAILNLGCLLRVASEIPAYEANLQLAWRILPVSAIAELSAVILFAFNLSITLLLPPPRAAVSITVPRSGLAASSARPSSA